MLISVAVKSIRNNQDAAKLGFDDDFIAKVQGTADFAYKELLNTCDKFSTTIANRGKKLEGFDKAIFNLKKDEKSCIGEEFVLRYISKNINKFPNETLSFEEKITVPGWKGKGTSNTRFADVANYNDKNDMILYEFKCVKGIPPNDFADQFCKDLAIVDGEVERINWIFDQGKLPQNFKDKIIKSIKSMDEIPAQALKKLNATDAKGFAKVINDKWFNALVSLKIC